MYPKLGWVEFFADSLSGATGTQVSVAIEDHVDPLKKLVVLRFHEPLMKGDYGHIQNIAHVFAKANDCVIEKIRRRGSKELVMAVLIKTRLGPVKKVNPLR